MNKLKTLYIVGPTASGKTALAIELARHIGAEIVCADSQTLRRGMNIGTAKPTVEEMQGIPHYMIDVIDPYDEYSLARFKDDAQKVISKIHASGKPVIVVGGTGLYVDALYFKYELPKLSTSDLELREKLSLNSVEELQVAIHDRGLSLPENQLNKRHLVNALIRSGQHGAYGMPEKDALIIGISPDRDELIGRINRRVEVMFESGFVEEVQSIIDTFGLPPRLFDAIGYRIVMRMLDSDITREEAIELFKIADRQYAKRQMSWFKRNKNIEWFASPADAKSFILERI